MCGSTVPSLYAPIFGWCHVFLLVSVQMPLKLMHDLGDEPVIGHHHRHRPEERLQVVGQLGAAGVAGVHRDEDAARGLEADGAPLKGKLLDVLQQRLVALAQLGARDLLARAVFLPDDPCSL